MQIEFKISINEDYSIRFIDFQSGHNKALRMVF
jgi:hypothetical protein